MKRIRRHWHADEEPFPTFWENFVTIWHNNDRNYGRSCYTVELGAKL